MSKFDRRPIRTKLCVTETPIQSNEIIHVDIWFLTKQTTFSTCIDELSKHISVHFISDKNSLTIVEKLRESFSDLGKPRKIIADNEFNTAFIRNFLNAKDVEFHFTSPNKHIRNSYIERFHLTFNERIRLFKLDRKDNDLYYMYDSIYNATGHKPNDLLHNKVDKSWVSEFETKTKIYNKTS